MGSVFCSDSGVRYQYSKSVCILLLFFIRLTSHLGLVFPLLDASFNWIVFCSANFCILVNVFIFSSSDCSCQVPLVTAVSSSASCMPSCQMFSNLVGIFSWR